jgi:hypothetical protein
VKISVTTAMSKKRVTALSSMVGLVGGTHP